MKRQTRDFSGVQESGFGLVDTMPLSPVPKALYWEGTGKGHLGTSVPNSVGRTFRI